MAEQRKRVWGLVSPDLKTNIGKQVFVKIREACTEALSVPSTPEEPKKSHFAERKVYDTVLENAKMVVFGLPFLFVLVSSTAFCCSLFTQVHNLLLLSRFQKGLLDCNPQQRLKGLSCLVFAQH